MHPFYLRIIVFAIFFVGFVYGIKFSQDGFVDIEAIDTVAVSGLDSYHVTERLARLAYAKK